MLFEAYENNINESNFIGKSVNISKKEQIRKKKKTN